MRHDKTVISQELAKKYGIPERLVESILGYLWDKQEPGDFIYACLCNQLCQAVNRADSESLECLPRLVKFLWNELPVVSWGSPRIVKAWLACREY